MRALYEAAEIAGPLSLLPSSRFALARNEATWAFQRTFVGIHIRPRSPLHGHDQSGVAPQATEL